MNTMHAAIRLALIGVGLTCVLPALDPNLKISQYHKQYWQVEQGLPHSYVSAVRHGNDGYLLVGTDEGMARFDGVVFRPMVADGWLKLSQRWVSALLPASDSTLWIGTFDGGVLQLRDAQQLRRQRRRASRPAGRSVGLSD